MFTKLFWKDAAERSISTFAQTFIAVAGVATVTVGDYSLLDVNYAPVLLVSLVAAGLSLLKALAATYKANTDTASLVVDTKPLIQERK